MDTKQPEMAEQTIHDKQQDEAPEHDDVEAGAFEPEEESGKSPIDACISRFCKL